MAAAGLFDLLNGACRMDGLDTLGDEEADGEAEADVWLDVTAALDVTRERVLLNGADEGTSLATGAAAGNVGSDETSTALNSDAEADEGLDGGRDEAADTGADADNAVCLTGATRTGNRDGSMRGLVGAETVAMEDESL